MATRLLALLLAAGLAQGCFVFEELDQGQETMDRLTQKQKDAEEESEGGGSEGEEEEKPSDWWQKARTLTPGGSSGPSGEEERSAEGSAVVRCRLADGTRFMRADECRGRGGTPSG